MSAWHLTVIAVIAAGCTVAALQLDSFLFTMLFGSTAGTAAILAVFWRWL